MNDALNRGAARNYELTNEVAVLRRRLEQRSRALNAVAARNAAARRALVAVIKLADITEPTVSTTKIHDAIGHEIIGEVMCPQDIEWPTVSLTPHIEKVQEVVQNLPPLALIHLHWNQGMLDLEDGRE